MAATPTSLNAPLQTVDAVAAALQTDPVRGLSAQEAALRLAQDGPNQLRTTPPPPAWRRLFKQFQDPLIYLLMAAVVVTLLAWFIEGRVGWPVDAVVIAVIVVLNGILGYVQEAKAADAAAALARMVEATSAVMRDGQMTRVPSATLVRGDLLVLGEGDAVGADARLVRAAALRVQEASLTGESEAVLKDAATLIAPAAVADQRNMVFKGTAVAQGTGLAIVTATGMATQMGAIAHLLAETRRDATPLQKEIRRVGQMLGLAVIVICVLVVGAVAAGHRGAQRGLAGVGDDAGRVAGRGRRARRPARHPVHGAGHRGAAHGAPPSHRQEPLLGRDPGLGLRHLHRQDRHPHPLGDDACSAHDRLGPHPHHGRGLRAHRRGTAPGARP